MIHWTFKRNGHVFRTLIVVLAIVCGTVSASSQTKRKKPKYLVPVDTAVRLRMNDKLSSKNAKVGNQFTSTVVTPVYAKAVEVIPAGSIVTGHVTHVDSASRKSQAGSLDVTFTSIKIPNGINHPISGSLVGSDGTDVKGKSSKKRNARFIGRGMVVGGLINGGAGVVTGGLFGAARGLIKKGEEAEVDPGTEFDMILNHSVSMSAFR